VSIWETRCYESGIPENVPDNIMKSNRAPSYKSIALAILRNDHNLYGLGFAQRESEVLSAVLQARRQRADPQYDMFAA